MAARKGRKAKAKTQVKRMARGARKGAAKVGHKVASGAKAAKTKAASAFGAIKEKFAKKGDEEE